MKLYGFYFRMLGKDCFYETNRTRRTNALAMDFINKVQNKMNRFINIADSDIEWVKNGMRKAVFEMKTVEDGEFAGMKYYTIDGENFSFGCDLCEDPTEHYILVY